MIENNDYFYYTSKVYEPEIWTELSASSVLCSINVKGCSGIGIQLTDGLVWRVPIPLSCCKPLRSSFLKAQLKFSFFQESFLGPSVRFNLSLLQILSYFFLHYSTFPTHNLTLGFRLCKK